MDTPDKPSRGDPTTRRRFIADGSLVAATGALPVFRESFTAQQPYGMEIALDNQFLRLAFKATGKTLRIETLTNRPPVNAAADIGGGEADRARDVGARTSGEIPHAEVNTSHLLSSVGRISAITR